MTSRKKKERGKDKDSQAVFQEWMDFALFKKSMQYLYQKGITAL